MNERTISLTVSFSKTVITNITQLNSQFDNFDCIDRKKKPKTKYNYIKKHTRPLLQYSNNTYPEIKVQIYMNTSTY